MNQMLRKALTDGDIRRRNEIFSILDEIGEDLDITETQFERARRAMTRWVTGCQDLPTRCWSTFWYTFRGQPLSERPLSRSGTGSSTLI